MFEHIKCPACGSTEWSTVDDEYDYPTEDTMIIRLLSYCDKCNHPFNVVNKFKYLESTIEEVENDGN